MTSLTCREECVDMLTWALEALKCLGEHSLLVFLVFPTSRGFGGVTEAVRPLNDRTLVSMFVIRLIPPDQRWGCASFCQICSLRAPPRHHFLQPPNSSRRRSSAPPSEMKVGRHIYRLLQLLKQERRCLFGSELLIIRQNSSTPNPNSSHSSPNQQSKLICVWSKSPANKCWAVVMEITFIMVGSTQEPDQDITRRGVGDAGATFVSGGTAARFLCGSALDQPWGDASPRLRWRSRIDLHPFIRAGVGSDCNHTSWPHLNQPSLQFADVELRGGRAQEGEISPTSPFSLLLWLCWWFHTLQNHVWGLKMIPGDDLRPWPSRFGSSVLPSNVEIWWLVYLFHMLPVLIKDWFWKFQAHFQPQNQHLSSQYMSNLCKPAFLAFAYLIFLKKSFNKNKLCCFIAFWLYNCKADLWWP